MSGPKRIIKVFIASPGNLSIERRAFKDTVDELNKGFGRGANVEFVPLGWEDALATTGRRPQDVINKDVDACDVFVLVMWRRWGRGSRCSARFLFVHRGGVSKGIARFERTQSPVIFVFLKQIDPGQMADPGKQLERVLAFRRKLELSRQVLYRGFEGEAGLEKELKSIDTLKHLHGAR